MSNYTVSLLGPAPWGFRLQGGKDFNMPLTISRLSEGGKAAQAGIEVGDVVLSIDEASTDGMAHLAAQNKIKACTGSLKLSLQRASPAAKPAGTTVQKDEPREHATIPVASITPMIPKAPPAAGTAYNKTARPFGATSSPRLSPAPFVPASSPLTQLPAPSPTLMPQHPAASPPPILAPPLHVHAGVNVGTAGRSLPVNAAKPLVTPPVNPSRQPKVYNTPINLYSSDNAHEVAEGQKRGLREGQTDGKQQNGTHLSKWSPRRMVTSAFADVPHHHLSDQSKKRLMQDTEDWQPKTGTAQSRSFSILAQMTGTERSETSGSEASKKTRENEDVNGETGRSTLEITEASPMGRPVTKATAGEPDTRASPVCTVATQTGEEDLTPTGPDSGLSPAGRGTTVERRICLDNPLDALPKGAPHPPPLCRDPRANAHIASLSAVKIAKARFFRGLEAKVTEMPPLVPSAVPGVTGGTPHSLDSGKCTVAVQTCDILVPDDASTTPLSVGAADPTDNAPPLSARTRFESPLEALPRASFRSPVWKQSPRARIAAATITTVLSAQARLSDPIVSRSLLDALLITPVTEPPAALCKQPQRRSTHSLSAQKAKSGELSEVLKPCAPATVSVKPMSKSSGMCRTSPASAKPSSTYKPSSLPGTAKTTAWQPTNSAVNSFSKTALPTAHVSPANSTSNSKVSSTAMYKPPLQDNDTLVQMAEHIPAGNRAPMCGHCNMVIRGPFLVAMGRSWHPEEFTCAYCHLSLADIGFVEENGAVYCEKCYEQFFAPECGRCQRKILGEIINALKQTWHVNCFVCVACKHPIRNNVFHMEDGDPYCEKDYYNLFGTSCQGCDFPIEAGDKFLQALGHTWHDTCFVCSVCCANLEGQTFFSKKEKLLCKKHAHTVNI
ncbi:PDZ and LIM domain protein 5-like isoform X3 [Leucoraja erinacea]|uniref:PDZ and LIM domain protein 5-like isoform X3 n=1 Tax=Leucoraja erinaceus TaxID=7782 RepID=UPI00245586E7|nr:PDZ and LIM domain protein 5-like isoform X3 [Leucoraja erinacea]